MSRGYKILAGLALGVTVSSVACSGESERIAGSTQGDTSTVPTTVLNDARGKIKHVVMIMQENRSFDSYFGTYPGADGIPMQEDGTPSVCVPDPATNEYVKPYHDPADSNQGGGHGADAAVTDVDGGKMDGFLKKKDRGVNALFKVSGWSAYCSESGQLSSCTSALKDPGYPPDFRASQREANGESLAPPDYAWTDLTYLLHENDVGWGYYVVAGTEPDCEDDDAVSCVAPKQDTKTPGIWNPLPYFDTVKDDGQLDNI